MALSWSDALQIVRGAVYFLGLAFFVFFFFNFSLAFGGSSTKDTILLLITYLS
jgi:hypothetical protein